MPLGCGGVMNMDIWLSNRCRELFLFLCIVSHLNLTPMLELKAEEIDFIQICYFIYLSVNISHSSLEL